MIKHKYLIITDERTGCTEFTDYLTFFHLNVAHDPQTHFFRTPETQLDPALVTYLHKIGKKKETVAFEDILPYFYEKFDVLKVCLISFDVETYRRIIHRCQQMNVKFIVVYRNPCARALSKVISVYLNRQISTRKQEMDITGGNGYSNIIHDFYQPFSVDIEEYTKYVYTFMQKFHAILDFLETQHINYSFIDIDMFHTNIDFASFSRLCSVLQLTCSSATFENMKERIVNFNPVDKKQFILNKNDIEKVNKTIRIQKIPLLRYNNLHVFM
jgi:hypothetical protein